MQQDGFEFLHAADTRAWLEQSGSLTDWPEFAASWNGMALDQYMADGGRYRRRRHAVFAAPVGDVAIARAPHQPHYQTVEYNPLHGGIERWFEPVPETIANGASMRTILRACRALFDSLSPGTSWHIETHQFRIEARSDEAGKPTPEGLHRDGVDYVLVLMIDRENIASGTTTIHGLDKVPLGSFTLTEPLDAALVDDSQVYHGVTAVRPLDPARPAHRDVLVVTFRAAQPQAA
nr:2OG-Fe dioxygenase family protein [Limobrevibacterium gyesilva]